MSSELATHVSGVAAVSAPTVLLVHGWPDSAEMWAPVAERLGDDFHVVAVDLPGVGASPPPRRGVKRPYALEMLARDLDAAITSLPSTVPVHLVGHDWGGVLGWRYVMTPAYAHRVASFTTLSGPSLDHMGLLTRRARRDRALARISTAQMLKSWYTWPLSMPFVRTGMWRVGAGSAFRRWLRVSEGVRGYPGRSLASDAAAMVPIYRSNIIPRLLFPEVSEIRIPVHVIVNERDRYVSPTLMRTLDRWVPDIEFSSLDAGHWSTRSHPDQVASLVGSWLSRAGDGARRPYDDGQ